MPLDSVFAELASVVGPEVSNEASNPESHDGKLEIPSDSSLFASDGLVLDRIAKLVSTKGTLSSV
jgi:hypothetical protein